MLQNFTGVFCEVFTRCIPNPCTSGGSCLPKTTSEEGQHSENQDVQCLCPPGRIGSVCQTSEVTSLRHFMCICLCVLVKDYCITGRGNVIYVQLAFAKFLSKIRGNFWGSAVSMILALYLIFSFIWDRNLAKANCTENHVCTSCDTVVLGILYM